MQENNIKIQILIISNENSLDNIERTVSNLKDNGFIKEEYAIAFKNNSVIEKFCKDNNINCFAYENDEDIYYDIPKKLKFDYISFINSGDTYSEKFKVNLLEYIRKDLDNIFVCPIRYDEKNYILNKNIKRRVEIDIEKNPDRIWIHLNSVFISNKLLSKTDKPKNIDLKYYVEQNFLTKLILLNGGYHIVHKVNMFSIKKMEDCAEGKDEDYDLLWYKNVFNNINDFFGFSKENYNTIIEYVKYLAMYIIKNIINENVNMKNKHILKDEKLNEFYENTKKVMKDVEDEIIMKTQGNKRVNYYLLRLKYGTLDKDIEYREFENKIHVINNNKMIFNASDTKIKILLMDYVNGNLIITATYPFPFDEKKLKIFIEYMDKKIYVEKSYLYSAYKAFGKELYENYTFDIKIPLKKNKEKQYIKFFLQSNRCITKLGINFNKPLSRLSNLKHAYWNCGDFTLNCRQESIMVMNNTKLRHLKREIKYIQSLIFNKEKEARKSGRLRIIYYLTKPLFRKEIWLFEDKIYKGGDNGEYLYTYASRQKDGIKKYYILKKDCIDAKRFKKEHKKFVEFGSLKHKLLFLNGDIVFTTHNNSVKHHSFDETTEKYFRNLFKAENVCIQHGLTVQNIPHLTNRINDNLKLFFLSSPIEKKNMSNNEYAYCGYENILKITGSPRYDGLKNNDKKQILITPTWRSYLALPVVKMAEARKHNDNFKNSDYFKIYNSLINNKKLIETAKEYGYKIIYLLHPCTSSQINDYDKNENVELIAATDDLNYEKILTESSLMVTDYSGVQFDFAYMYKPIIYFHPDKLPPSYEEGEYKYESMALGEITKTNEDTVDLLCEYIKNECKIKDKYRERINKFFKYHDYNNCKRIYEEIMEFRKIKGENNGIIK